MVKVSYKSLHFPISLTFLLDPVGLKLLSFSKCWVRGRFQESLLTRETLLSGNIRLGWELRRTVREDGTEKWLGKGEQDFLLTPRAWDQGGTAPRSLSRLCSVFPPTTRHLFLQEALVIFIPLPNEIVVLLL